MEEIRVFTEYEMLSRNIQDHYGLSWDDVSKEFIDSCMDNMVKELKIWEPKASDEVIRAFIRTFMELEITQDYDIRNLSFKVIGRFNWKEPEMIRYTPEDEKLLEDYSFNYLINREDVSDE